MIKKVQTKLKFDENKKKSNFTCSIIMIEIDIYLDKNQKKYDYISFKYAIY